jgi:DNA-binding MarR family transcriptional regulator
MNQDEYVSIRRAYNLVRQNAEAAERLSFPELAILCHLFTQDGPLPTASIAAYQHALRSTMTHRTKHLVSFGLLERCKCDSDRRNVNCIITKQGRAFVEEACEAIRVVLRQGTVLSRTSVRRIVRYVDAMGTVLCGSSELVVLHMYGKDESDCTIGKLARDLGFLQPTMSMAVSKLERSGLVTRTIDALGHVSTLALTKAGMLVAQDLGAQIEALVVRRESKRSSAKLVEE